MGWGSDTWKKTINLRIVNTQICLLISSSPFRVSSKKQTLIRLCNVSQPGPVGIWCQNDVVSTSMRRTDVNTTSFHVMCPLGLFMHNMGEMQGYQLLSE